MKPKLKLSDFWYYYKWYFLFAFLVLWVIFNFLSERSQIVEPDAIVSFVTLEELSTETLSRLQQTVTTHAEDTNKDGRIEVEINVYAYDGQGSDGWSRWASGGITPPSGSWEMPCWLISRSMLSRIRMPYWPN